MNNLISTKQIKTKIILKNVFCLLLLKNSRISVASNNRIKIFNKFTYNEEINIRAHSDYIWYILQLLNENLVSCSNDYSIKIYKIYIKSYIEIQHIKAHLNSVYKVIEIINLNYIISCSTDKSIKFWEKISNTYDEKYCLFNDSSVYDIIQINNNELVSANSEEQIINFWNINTKIKINKIRKIFSNFWNNILCKINENFLVVGGYEILYLVNLNNKTLYKQIETDNWINSILIINNNIFLTGDNGNIKMWKIENNNIKLIDTKEKIFKGYIYSMIKLKNNDYIALGLDDELIII